MTRSGDVRALERDLSHGRMSRRDFIRRATALGLTASGIAAALAACGASPTPTSAPAAATAAATAAPTTAATTPAGAATAAPGGAGAASPTRAGASPAATSGAASAGPAKRGGGGTLKMLQWQAPTILNPHLSSGTKDDLVTYSILYERLVEVDNDGGLLPRLAAEVPSRENGGLAPDGKSATWKLKSGVKWSDGQPFTAADVDFTWEYATDPKTAATSVSIFENVAKVEKVDDLTVKYTFAEPNPAWFRPGTVPILPRHVFEKDKGEPARNSPNNLKPVGTGPYKVDEFKPGDFVAFSINENYREANKPFFDRVEVKGGGDAPSAARAVLQTGDYDYAWNLQIDDTIIKQLEQGGKGVAGFTPGGGIERLFINFADPNKEVDGERSSIKSQHPFFTDLKVRQAFALGCDRDTIVKGIYGRGGQVGINVLEDPPKYRSPNNKPEFNLDKAAALLEEAGWKKGASGYREKGGVTLSVVYSTTVNQVRQKTQQVVKDGWEKLGIKTELKSVDSAVFFTSDAGNPDTSGHMYVDVQMYTTSAAIDPQAHMRRWTTIALNLMTKEGKWSGGNDGRYKNPKYDDLWQAAKTEMDEQKRANLFIQMNDILIQDVAMIPLVNRNNVYGYTKSLQNINSSEWATDYWNIANWVKA
jgi:peptide/nickel transport system substrate-binding protein